jgi:tRNA(fMet)-specific endonuclease VapC
MLVLDTDLLTIIQREKGPVYERLIARLQSVLESDTVAITIVSLEEQMRGWLAFLNTMSAQQPGSVVLGYRRLHALFRDFEQRVVLDFDDAAFERYTDLKARKVRIATMDMRIAAICLANDATLLTRNVRDFEKVPALKIEDWTRD